MKLGVSTYSFSKEMRAGRMTQFDTIAKAAEMGFAILEFSELHPVGNEPKAEFAARVREEVARRGLEMGNYTIGADFLNNPGGWEAEVERLYGEVDLAVALGAPGMRHDVTSGRRPDTANPISKLAFDSFDSVVPTLAKACRKLTEYAAGKGVRTMSENHGFFSQDSERIEKLIAAVNHPNYGALIDMGNFLCVDEKPELAVGRLAPYAFHVHAKDFFFKSGQEQDPGEGWFRSRGGNYLRGTIIGHGQVPVAQCIQILRRAGYQGALSIEFEGMEDPINSIRIGLANLRRYLGE